MKRVRSFQLLVVILIGLSVLFVGCKREAQQESKPVVPAKTGGEGVQIAQKTCPVTGDPIDKRFYVDHQGRRIYFCCEACIKAFKKDPDKYVKKLDAQLGEQKHQ